MVDGVRVFLCTYVYLERQNSSRFSFFKLFSMEIKPFDGMKRQPRVYYCLSNEKKSDVKMFFKRTHKKIEDDINKLLKTS